MEQRLTVFQIAAAERKSVNAIKIQITTI